MNARLSGYIVSVVLIVMLALPALAIAPFAGAQGGPPQVGLRPDAPQYALHGPYWVGMVEAVIDSDGERPLPVRIWYPALNPTGAEEKIEYPTDVQFFPVPEGVPSITYGHALANAQPDLSGAPYPLVVYSPGFSATREQGAYLTEHLASHGFVTMSITHPDPPYGEFWPALVLRPLDVPRVLDYAEGLVNAGGPLVAMIDMGRVGLSGWSSGGNAALAVAGARLNLTGLESLCAEHPEFYDDMDCAGILDNIQGLLDLAGLDSLPDGVWPSWSDPRVDVIVPHSGGGSEFGPEGLAFITVPAMILSESGDGPRVGNWFSRMVYDNVSSARKSLVVFENAGHMIFGGTCEDNPWLLGTDPGLFWVCADSVWDSHRAYDLINHFTTAFLLATLKGDAEAAAALSPEAVAFPGITYQATGF